MRHSFLKPNESYSENLKVQLDLLNYAKKANLKVATGVDTSSLAVKSDLICLKAEVDKIDINKLKTFLC